MSFIPLPESRALDVICLGRAGVDLYAREADVSFSEVSGFEKYVGGSPANIAVALAKLRMKTGFIGAVSDDGLGRYVQDYLKQVGVDLQGMQVKGAGSRTSLAVTEMAADKPEVVIYRNHAADICLKPSDIDSHYLAQARILLLSGTALSASPSREAVLMALAQARRHNTVVVLDMDYRPYAWEDTETAAIYYHWVAQHSHIVIGNQEEFAVLKGLWGHCDEALLREQYLKADSASTQIVIMKAGDQGSRVLTHEGVLTQGIFPVEVRKPFGAGDAFAGSLLYGLLNELSLEDAVMLGSAAAALNVSRDSCSEAMPTRSELAHFLEQQGQPLETIYGL